jgi:hypothetical protein
VQGAWIDPGADSVEAVVAVAHNCPSGAIQYQRHDGRPDEQPPAVNVINVRAVSQFDDSLLTAKTGQLTG